MKSERWKNIEEFYIPEVFIDAIKNQALNSEDEIYGWLIGYQKDGISYQITVTIIKVLCIQCNTQLNESEVSLCSTCRNVLTEKYKGIFTRSKQEELEWEK